MRKLKASFLGTAALAALLLLLASNPHTAMGGPEDAPDRPTGLTGDVYHDRVELRWDEPGDEDTVTGYQILRLTRGVDYVGNFHIHVNDTESPENSYTDTNVKANTRYVYRIKARNGGDLSPQSTYFDADTPEKPEASPPAAPEVFAVHAPSADGVVVEWLSDAEDDSITGYRILRGTDADSLAAIKEDTGLENTDSGRCHYTDTTAPAGQTVFYAVQARNAYGLSRESNAFETAIPPYAPDFAPTLTEAAMSPEGGVILRWEQDPANDTITGHQVLRGPDADSLAVTVEDTGSADTTYTDTAPPDGQTLHYAVRARNETGLSPQSNSLSVTTPAAPRLLSKAVSPDGHVTLLWQRDPDDGTITGYRVLRGPSQDSLAVIAEVTISERTTYTDKTAPLGQMLGYAVQARRDSGLSPPSNLMSVTTPAPPRDPVSLQQRGAEDELASIDTDAELSLASPRAAGVLHSSNDVDWFKLSGLEQGMWYEVSVLDRFHQGGGNASSMEIAGFYGSDGAALTEGTDYARVRAGQIFTNQEYEGEPNGPLDRNNMLRYRKKGHLMPPSDGDYFVAVRPSREGVDTDSGYTATGGGPRRWRDGNGNGLTYTMRLRALDDHPNDSTTTAEVSPGEPFQGELFQQFNLGGTAMSDWDWVRVAGL